MKIFIAFLVVFLSFSDARQLGGNRFINTASRLANMLNTVGEDADVQGASVSDPSTINVTVNVEWTYSDGDKVTKVVVVVKNLNVSQYAAIGLGQNKSSMGETHVFMCKRLPNDTIVLQRYINPGGHEHPQHAGAEAGGVLTLGPQTFSEGVVTCNFNLSNFVTQPFGLPGKLRPLSQTGSYYPLFAVGVLLNTTEPYYHGNDSRTIIQDTAQLNQNVKHHFRLSKPDADGMKYFH